MLRMRLVLAVLALTAIVGIVPVAQAQTVQVMIAGSSAMWQTVALGAYNLCGAGCYHYTSSSNFNLTDTRPPVPIVDTGAIWIVGDNAGTKVWAFIKVDSVVGVRCYFAQPHCGVSVASFPAVGNSISVWPDGTGDALPPAAVQALFTAGSVPVGVGATDIRPEDAAFAQCRANSQLGVSAVAGAQPPSDGLDGLGYNVNNNPGVCPKYVAAQGNANPGLVGTAILSGYPGSTGKANVVAFNISGNDPFNNTKIPTATVYAVGASPVVFITERDKGQLGALTNATEPQLQQVFSGLNCDNSAFGLAGGAINVFLREPLSGTMNTVEATVFRRPTVYPNPVLGLSQEKGVPGNPLTAAVCGDGFGKRYRAIGTGEEVKSVKNSGAAGVFADQRDGIGYTFFSYGNVSSIANNAAYGYLQLNGIDPIFQTYGSTLDPGQPAIAGALPGAANLPAACAGGVGAFPCDEAVIWKNGFSFPNLRNGTYRAWSLLRIVSNGTALTNAETLIKNSQKYVVTTTPDYVPALAVSGLTTKELGLKLLRSHYLQFDGAGNPLRLKAGVATNLPENGGDMGGYIIPTTIGVTTYKQTQLVQSGTATSLGPVARP